jgi:hypothetical protein
MGLEVLFALYSKCDDSGCADLIARGLCALDAVIAVLRVFCTIAPNDVPGARWRVDR